LQRIAAYVGQDPCFADQRELEAYMREINTGYGPLTDAQWAHLAAHGSRRDETGGWRLHYDPKLAEPFKQGFSEPVELWPLWDLISCPVLILRGSESDILTAETAAEMVARKPGTRLVEFKDVGHAPMLMDSAQIEAVRQWLLG
jgi:pimeloyl-ACP methyl ester carboxylesterase